MMHTLLKRSLLLGSLSVAAVLGGTIAASEWDPEVNQILQADLGASERALLADFLGNDGAYPGPIPEQEPFGDVSQQHYRARAVMRSIDGRLPKTVVKPSGGTQGSGTAVDPWRGLLSAVVTQAGNEQQVFVLPAGYYEDAGVKLGNNWLEAEPGAVLLAPSDPGGARFMLSLEDNGGVVGLRLDGSANKYDPALGSRNLHGIQIEGSRSVVIADCHLLNIPNNGITGRGAGVLLLNNRLEQIGHSGVRMRGSNWLVINNRVYYAGIWRGGEGALGDDGIIVAGGGNYMIVAHNLVVSARRPNGRHGIGTHNANFNRIENNVVVTEGELRGGVNLSDGSNHNELRRNLILSRNIDEGRAGNGIRVNGQQNLIEENAIFFTNGGINAFGWPATSFSTIRNNLLFNAESAIVNGPFDTTADNEIINR